MTAKKDERKYLDRAFFRNVLLMAGLIFVLLFFGGFAGLYQVINDQNFASGVSIDGVDVSGMTYEQAEQAVAVNSQVYLDGVHILLEYDGVTTELDAEDLGVTLNEEEVIPLAYSYNKDETDSVEERYNKTVELSRGKDFATQIVIDTLKLRETVESYTASYTEDAVDAKALFDQSTCTFTYLEEEAGTAFNIDALVGEITCMLCDGDYSSLQVSGEVVSPAVTLNALEENTVLIAQYETTAGYNENRNVNVQKMCEAVNGLEIKQGETLSLNELVGERTEEKGFLLAPAIINGVVVDDLGGGICQLAGTLYNAALLADMEIVERVKHSWPSSYLPIGLDATLNWDDKDLKLKNTSDYSIYISAAFIDQVVTVKLYGQPLEDGVAVEIENDILKVISPGQTEFRNTSELPEGVRETVREARDGYVVDVYRIYKKYGEVISKELISSDTYSAINKLVLVGSNIKDK
ncbi:MAG: VanW family protein [Eubacteriales bacterium]|nr:VanW family protein [Eubacteriales bacterium]